MPARPGRCAAASGHAAGQGDGGDAVIGDRTAGTLAADVGGDEGAFRQPGITPGGIEQLRGADDVLGRLQQEAVTAIRIGTAARITCQYGKFHGMMPSTTPSGR